MKFNLLTAFALCFMLASCGSDDCTQADWLGTYTGTLECNDGSDPETTTTVITAGSSETTILLDGEEVTIDGCKATSTAFGITTEIELDGNKLTGTSSGEILGEVLECTFEGTK